MGDFMRSHKKRLLKIWFISYLFILLVPIILNGFMYKYVLSVVENQIENSTSLAIDQTKGILDNLIGDSNSTTQAIYVNKNLQSILNQDDESSKLPYDLYEFRNSLNAYIINSDMIDDCVVYLKHTNRIVSSKNGVMDSNLYYDMHFKELINKSDFQNLFDSPYNGDIATLDSAPDKLFFIQTVPLALKNSISTNIALFFNRDALNKLLANNAYLKSGAICILDRHYNLVYSTNPSLVSTHTISWSNHQINETPSYLTIDTTDFIVAKVPSNIPGIHYGVVIPKQLFWADVNRTVAFIILNLSFCFILGGIVAYVLARHQYHPVKRILESISNYSSTDENSNEYKIIEQAYEHLILEQNQLQENLSSHTKMLFHALLRRLLLGELNEEYNNTEQLNKYNINFSYKFFLVVVVHIEIYAFPSHLTLDQENTEQDNKLTEFIIQNILEEKLNSFCQAYSTIDQNNVVLIVNTDFPIDTNYQKIKEIIDDTQNYCYNQFNIEFSASISDSHETINNISSAYAEALHALEYRLLLGKDEIISYSQLSNNVTCYSYPYDQQLQLSNYLRMGNQAKAKELIHDIVSTNYKINKISLEMATCLLYDIVGTVVKTFDKKDDITFLNELKPVKRLHLKKNEGDVISELMNIIDECCDYYKNMIEKAQSNGLSTRIIHYIADNYIDTELNISSLGAHFGISPTYLSKLFKEQTGELLLDYINKVRLSKAKKLLVHTNKSIKEICFMVGYTNSNSFNRLFKKHEGITPGSYRKISGSHY